MSSWSLMAADLVAILVLVFGMYVPRHRRRDMIVAFLAINTGVLAIAGVLSTLSASVGLGLGLFGVLSIIRLRSDELNQVEVAYYFVALALGLLGGTSVDTAGLSLALMATLLVAIWVGDNPRLLSRARAQRMVLDRAFIDERELIAHLADLLDANVHHVAIRNIDLVNDTTIVDVRYDTRTCVTRRADLPRMTPAAESLP